MFDGFTMLIVHVSAPIVIPAYILPIKFLIIKFKLN